MPNRGRKPRRPLLPKKPDSFRQIWRAGACHGRKGWLKNGERVRSVVDVFNLIVIENGTLAGTLTSARAGRGGAPITDPEKMQAVLKTAL